MDLEAAGIRAGYRSIEVLHGVDLSLAAGEFVAVVGPNGAGKSTLLRTLVGALPVSAGTVRVDGKPMARQRPDQMVRLGVALVPEGRRLFPQFSVLQTLKLAAGVKLPRARPMSIDDVFGLFPPLARRATSPAGKLSGGEQQMLAVARALMLAPQVLLLDEPSTGLAPLIVRELIRVIERLAGELGLATLIVEQNVAILRGVVSRAYILENGKVAHSGPAAEVLDADAVRQSYLGT